MTTTIKDLAETLRDAIAADGRSVYRLSKDSRIPINTLSRFVNCELELSMPNASKLCLALGLSLKKN